MELELATIEEIADELKKRFPQGCLLVGMKEHKLDETMGMPIIYYRNGVMNAIGLAEYAKTLLIMG